MSGAVVSASVCVQPYHGSGYRLEIYGKDGTLMMIGGGEAGQEVKRKIMGGHKDDKALQELPVPERLKWVPEEVRNGGPSYDVGQMWVKFAKAIRTGTRVEPDFDHAVRRHRMLDAIVRASRDGAAAEGRALAFTQRIIVRRHAAASSARAASRSAAASPRHARASALWTRPRAVRTKSSSASNSSAASNSFAWRDCTCGGRDAAAVLQNDSAMGRSFAD